MRAFLGIELDPTTALQIGDWRDRQFSHNARPVPVANFHITLAFAGELAPGAVDELCGAVDNWVAASAPKGHTLVLDRTGFWPNPGLYWLGPSQWPASLDAQAKKLRHLAAASGARRDRKRFLPHITLFRRSSSAPPMPAHPPAFRLTCDHIALFESQRTRNGVSYEVLRDWPLVFPGAHRN